MEIKKTVEPNKVGKEFKNVSDDDALTRSTNAADLRIKILDAVTDAQLYYLNHNDHGQNNETLDLLEKVFNKFI